MIPTTPPPRRRDSDHPRRRLEDADSHKRLLRLVITGVVVGVLVVVFTFGELRYRNTARSADLRAVRDLTEQMAEIEEANAADTRAHRIRTEELMGRLCDLIVGAHEGLSASDCLPQLTHPSDPNLPADQED